MRRIPVRNIVILSVFLTFLFVDNTSANEVKIIGEVNDNCQLVTKQGGFYEISDAGIGSEMMDQVGGVVEIFGEIIEQESVKTIIVTSYQLLNRVKALGKVTDGFQLVTDQGDVYEIGATLLGEEVMDQVGRVVEVTGSVAKKDGVKTLIVTFYRVIEDQ